VRTILSIGTFAAAVVSFSRLWQGVRSALDGQRLYGSAEALVWMGLFVGSMGYVALVIYAADRAAGRTRRRIAIFDRVLDHGRQSSHPIPQGVRPHER
jgi:hypothetical protein